MVNTFFRWYGGKNGVVNELSRLIPPHTSYFELFAGSCALLLNHCRSEVEVVNDFDKNISNLLKVMADRELGKKLCEKLKAITYSEDSFNEAKKLKAENYKGGCDIDRAVYEYTLITQSFNATRKSFSKKLFMDDFAYKSWVIDRVDDVFARMSGVTVLNMDALEILKEIKDNDGAFAFLDPPYRPGLRGKNATKIYGKEMPEEVHIELLEMIKNAKCKILLCGYKEEKNDLYDRYLLPCGWKCYKLADLYKFSQIGKVTKDIGEEFIWVNYELPKIAKYIISMKEYNSLHYESEVEDYE